MILKHVEITVYFVLKNIYAGIWQIPSYKLVQMAKIYVFALSETQIKCL